MYATLWECVSEGDLLLRRTALKFLEKGFRQKGMTENMVLLAQGIEDDEIKSDILGMLGRRGEMAARPYILSCILDGSPTVRAAALEAAARLEGRPLDSGQLTALLLALK